jgi:hypothetical protein
MALGVADLNLATWKIPAIPSAKPASFAGGTPSLRLAWNGVGEAGYSEMIRNDVVFQRNLNRVD